jgi:hypothetical protein
MTSLLPQHRRLIDASAIAPAVAAARGYRSIETAAELKRLGFSERQARPPALLIPIYDARGEMVLYQARPDFPRIVDGKPVKYETPCKARIRMDVPPGAATRIGDPAVPLFITEGARKADAGVSKGLCCIALLGVWNFRGTNEAGGKTALAEWETIALNGRKVYIVFDSDVVTKREVCAALFRLKAFIESRGADVLIGYLPGARDGGKQGLDDYFASGATVDDLLRHVEKYPRFSGIEEAPPGPYAIEDGRIVWMRPEKDGSIPVPLASFTAKITAEILRDDGAGEPERAFEIAGASASGTDFPRAIIPAAEFSGMNWPLARWGVAASVSAGMGARDRLREAIQFLSGDVHTRRIFTHTGWRRVDDEWVYLHAEGAIGEGGPVDDVDVELGAGLEKYILPPPPSASRIRDALREVLRLRDVAPRRISDPLLACIFRAALRRSDFSLHLTGKTGVRKSELAALAQRFFGKEMHAKALPGNWSSTANSTETMAFTLKDSILALDDFAPSGTQADEKLQREADRILRSQGNASGRRRLRADLSLVTPRVPRGTIISTGEDVPRGDSLRARLLILDVRDGDVDLDALTGLQAAAAEGLYAEALSAFVAWLAPRLDRSLREYADRMRDLRGRATLANLHGRTPEIAADLAIGIELFSEFARGAGALKTSEAERLRAEAWASILDAAGGQRDYQGQSDPVLRFTRLVAGALAGGEAHLADLDGSFPGEGPERWGWRSRPGRTPDHPGEWVPQGRRIGWVAEDGMFLEAEAVYAVCQELGRRGGGAVGVQPLTLWKRLREAGLLLSWDSERQRNTVRRRFERADRTVIHLPVDFPQADPSPPEKPSKPSNGPGDLDNLDGLDGSTDPRGGAGPERARHNGAAEAAAEAREYQARRPPRPAAAGMAEDATRDPTSAGVTDDEIPF